MKPSLSKVQKYEWLGERVGYAWAFILLFWYLFGGDSLLSVYHSFPFEGVTKAVIFIVVPPSITALIISFFYLPE
ncbi:uncharacterized protein METZ01_LOCUS502332 [marine metagenome]|uniref:Uncharacterized protein n=1 Tax=marine metagenome TaxID=408172 RepID=A0A383E061_9ZZZZ